MVIFFGNLSSRNKCFHEKHYLIVIFCFSGKILFNGGIFFDGIKGERLEI